MSAFDWPALLNCGLRRLRLRPDEFWRLTPAELAVMLGQTSGSAPMTRTDLDALIRAYPDMRKE